MDKKILEILKQNFELTKIEVNEYKKIKVAPMSFSIEQYDIKNVGNLCLMKGKALGGLMKMDTFVITPTKIDAPLFSYDRILALGNDTLIIEMYDTQLGKIDLSKLTSTKQKYRNLPNHDLGQHWYDSIKLNVSDSKKGKKLTNQFDTYFLEYFINYTEILASANVCDEKEKRLKSQEYVDGLLNNGGPSTDAFVKKIGIEKTKYFFDTIMFGTNKK